ncbi:hypothetical protein ACGF13_34510 [Kitasatospora sp. NPDC048286]|uniref:hypothetical protein n=1 Tax=Kitasatospora sp. NPDC048286 TaxID=3364047 RepID=UPI00370FF6FA
MGGSSSSLSPSLWMDVGLRGWLQSLARLLVGRLRGVLFGGQQVGCEQGQAEPVGGRRTQRVRHRQADAGSGGLGGELQGEGGVGGECGAVLGRARLVHSDDGELRQHGVGPVVGRPHGRGR